MFRMYHLYRLLLLPLGMISLAYVAALGNEPADSAKTSENSFRPTLITPIQAIIPQSLANKVIEEPKVVALVQISWQGSVEDLVIIEASHIGLVHRAESLIRKAIFDTRGAIEKESLRFELILPFKYPASIGLASKSTMDDVEIMINSVKKDEAQLRYCPANKLDEPLAIIDRGDVYKAMDEEDNLISGTATVQIYVNHEGEVRLPRVISYSHEEVAKAAVLSFSDMQFTKPLFEGIPAVTKVQLPFSIK